MSILHHLSLLHKFSILGLMGLLMGALPTFLYVKESLNNISTLRQEVVGTPPLIALNKVVQLLQVHRGLSASMLSGNEELGARRPGVRDALTKAIHEADVRFATAQMPAAQSTTWAQLKQTWKALEETVGVRSIAAGQSTAQHSQLIASVMLLGESLRHTYGLEMDHNPDTSALIQTSLVDAPMLTEKLGVMRAQGSSFLVLGNLPPQAKGSLLALQQRVGEVYGETFRNFERAISSNPRFHQALAEPVKDLKTRIDATRQMADKNLIHATEFTMRAPDYFNDFTQTIDAVFAVNTIAMDALEESLRLRMAQKEQLLMWMALAMMAVMLITAIIGLVFVRSIAQPLIYAKKLAQAAAQGNLSGADIPHGSNEVGELIQAQQQMRAKLCPVVSQVRIGSQNVANASAEIAQGNNDLSTRTENQASALGQTSVAMEQLSSTVQKNADSARKANELAENACTVAVKGGEVVAQVVRTMHSINASSQKISDIIGVIDSIAFQTNILALNAAVEAARAGEQGRGFAVVASEVRLLASRSAQAAQEIKTLIQASVERVEQGSLLVDNAGATMTQVVDSIRLVTSIMGEITVASQKQSQGVAQIDEAITHMDESTQQNASLVEQMAAAASALRAQAQDLVNVVAIFQIGHESDHPAHAECAGRMAYTSTTHISFDQN